MSLFYTLWKCHEISVFRGYRNFQGNTDLKCNDLFYASVPFLYPLKHHTAWKVSKYGVFSGPYFLVFSPNTGKYGPGKTPCLDTFHKVSKNQSFPTFLGGTEMEHWLILDNSVFIKINDQKIPGKLLIFCCVNLRILHQTWLNLISRTFC